jgi:hypothetical protein
MSEQSWKQLNEAALSGALKGMTQPEGGRAAGRALENLIGLQLQWAGYAADMRTFGFSRVVGRGAETEWALHIQCAWRIEREARIVTGKSDWYEAEDESWIPGIDSELSATDRLQQCELRKLLAASEDLEEPKAPLLNNTDLLVVETVDVGVCGDFAMKLTGDYCLRVFPDASRREFWRVFEWKESGFHYVCEQ